MVCDNCGLDVKTMEIWGTDGSMELCNDCVPDIQECSKCGCMICMASGLIIDNICATCSEK